MVKMNPDIPCQYIIFKENLNAEIYNMKEKKYQCKLYIKNYFWTCNRKSLHNKKEKVANIWTMKLFHKQKTIV